MRPLRIPVIQTSLAWILAQWMRFCFATIRWTVENGAMAEAVWADGGGVLVAFWHSRIAIAPVAWKFDRAQPIKALISLSPDGQFVARAVARLGFPAIRGSSSNKDKAKQSKGGTQALRDGLRQLKIGALALTPDGPRGPNRQMAEGLPMMARMSGAPVLLVGVSCKPCVRLKSWDRALVPLPFGRGAVVWDRVAYPQGAEMAEVIADWTGRLTTVEARADALVGLERL
jgi:Uncharacterized protein conserved in bacteria